MIGGKITEIKERPDAHVRLKVVSEHPDDIVNECYVRLAYKAGLATLLQPGDRIWWHLDKAHIHMTEGSQTVIVEKIGQAFRDLEAPHGSSVEEGVEYLGSHPGTALFRLTPQPSYNLMRNGEIVQVPLDAVGFCPHRAKDAFVSVVDRASAHHPHAGLFEMAVNDMRKLAESTV